MGTFLSRLDTNRADTRISVVSCAFLAVALSGFAQEWEVGGDGVYGFTRMVDIGNPSGAASAGVVMMSASSRLSA